MTTPTVELPSPVTYGTVKCNVGKMVGDITGALTPDISLINGKIRITPNVNNIVVISPSGNYTLSTPPEEWLVTNGKLRDKNGNEGVRYIASDSLGKYPTHVQYKAEFFIDGLLKKYQPHSIIFDVVANAIVDLSLLVSQSPTAPTVVVNSYEDRVAVQVALSQAQAAVADAQGAATAAGLSAQQAANSAANAHAAIIILSGANTPVPPGTPSGTVVVHVP